MEETITQRRRIPRLTNAQAGEINGMVPPQAVELEKSVLGALMLDKETLSKMDGIQTSYATKNLEYVVKSVIWYAVLTGAGFILFKRRDLF